MDDEKKVFNLKEAEAEEMEALRKYIAEHPERFTLADEPIPIDMETGNIIEENLSERQKEKIVEIWVDIAKNARHLYADAMLPIQEQISDTVKHFQEAAGIAEIKELQSKFSEQIRVSLGNLKPAFDFVREVSDLSEYIEHELEKDEYNGVSLAEFLNDYSVADLYEAANDQSTTVYKVIEAARAAKEKTEHVTVQRADSVEYPLDKINYKAWNQFAEDTNGQVKLVFDLLPKKRNLQATAYYSINFDNLGDNVKITKRLLAFDKRVYIAVSALYNAGNDVITATQIHYAMGNTSKPSPNQIKKIDDSLTKMRSADIILHNQREHDALNGKYPLFRYDGSLLPIERITATVNGQLTESAIHIFREPPLMSFAKERRQVTTINVALLQSPINKTEVNISIADYLIDRISKAKNGKGRSCRILFKTLYEHTHIKEKKQKQRAKKTIDALLSHYRQEGFIKRHTMQGDGVTVYF